MRKITFLAVVALTLLSLGATAQNERVLLFECFTNTGCGPCAQQNPGLDALINANVGHVAAIKYHMSWPAANDPMYLHNVGDNNARRSVYEVNSVPHTVVDGIRYAAVPSGLTQAAVNNWLAIQSPLEMRLSYVVDAAANTITVHVMGQASTAIDGNLKLYVGVIEREIHFNSAPGSNGERDFYNVMKKLLPTSTGIAVGSMEEGQYFAYSFTWELANIYNMDQLDAIAWVQVPSTKEVIQACLSSESMEPFFELDASVDNLSLLKSMNCSGTDEPVFQLSNFGSQALTSATIEVFVNDGLVKTFDWTGNLATFESETVTLGEVNFDVELNNTMEVRIASINGGVDQASSNNIASATFKGTPDIAGKTLVLTVRTDDAPQETTWRVTDLSTGAIVQEGGPYEAVSTVYQETITVPGDGCYDFTIFDAGGNGLTGNGVYGLKAGNITLFSGRDFGESESNEFFYEVFAGVDDNATKAVEVYPNPTTGLLNVVCEGIQKVTVYNLVGQRVYEGMVEHGLQIDMKPFGAGIYAVQVGDVTQRVIVK